MLQPLTNLMLTKIEFKWEDVEHKTFEEIKRIVARNTLLAYSDFNKKV